MKMIKLVFVLLLMTGLVSCGASVYKYIKNEETGKLEIVEKYSTKGPGKISGEFGTGGKIETDTGLRVPDLDLRKD